MIRSRLRSRARVPSPVFLPTVGTAPQVAYGVTRLIPTYTGACCRVVRAFDSATQDIGFINGRINMGQAISFAAGSELTVDIWYDQTGNGRNALQTTLASRPVLRGQNAFKGLQGISFDGRRPTTSIAKNMLLPAGIAVDRQNNTTFEVVAPSSSYNANAHFEIGNATTRALLCTSTGFSGLALSLGSGASPNRRDNLRSPRGNPSVNALRMSSTASRVAADTTTTDFAANTAGTATGGLLGGSVLGASFNGTLDFFAFVSYAAALNDTDYTLVNNALRSAHNVSYDQTNTLISVGDSITEGTGAQFLRNKIRQTYDLLSKDVHFYNCGVHGTTAATINANRSALFGMAIRSGTNTIVTFAAGTNDLGASTSANTLWTTHVQPCIAFIKSFGYQVIVETVIPRADFDAAKETERLAYNQLLRDNAVAEGFTLCDYTTNAAFDSQADASNTTFYDPDGVHLNSTGYGVQASILAPLVNGLLT